LAANISRGPQIFSFRRKDLAQVFQGSPIFQSKVCKEQSKVLKAKAKSSFVFPSSSQDAIV
jgi:hypothetical protein